jgi:hypothetical protein
VTPDLHEYLDTILDRLDAAAKAFPIKALAPLIRGDLTPSKAESTLRNELSQQPGYKLGIITAIQILWRTGDLSALDAIEELFGRTAWAVPTMDKADPLPVMAMAGHLAREFARTIEETSDAVAEGKLGAAERATIIARLEALQIQCIRFKAVLKAADTVTPGSRDGKSSAHAVWAANAAT